MTDYAGSRDTFLREKLAVPFDKLLVPEVLSVTKGLLPLICFKPLLLENRKRYDKKAFYQVDR